MSTCMQAGLGLGFEFDSACWSTWTAAGGRVSIMSVIVARSSADTTGGSVLPASVLAS